MAEKEEMESVESFLQHNVMNSDNWKTRSITDLKKGTRKFYINKRAAIIETKRPHSPDKIIVLDEQIFPDHNETAYRFAYYIRSEKTKKFVWGQYNLSISPEDFTRLKKESLNIGFKL